MSADTPAAPSSAQTPLAEQGRTWSCEIGYVADEDLPDGADWPMRLAVKQAFYTLTGKRTDFCSSGWGRLTAASAPPEPLAEQIEAAYYEGFEAGEAIHVTTIGPLESWTTSKSARVAAALATAAPPAQEAETRDVAKAAGWLHGIADQLDALAEKGTIDWPYDLMTWAGQARFLARKLGGAPEARADAPAPPHPWYGDCDAFGPEGECSECAKPRFPNRETWERWLQAPGPREAKAITDLEALSTFLDYEAGDDDEYVEVRLGTLRALETALRAPQREPDTRAPNGRERPVHNHGPEEGPSFNCRESLIGDCIRFGQASDTEALREHRIKAALLAVAHQLRTHAANGDRIILATNSAEVCEKAAALLASEGAPSAAETRVP